MSPQCINSGLGLTVGKSFWLLLCASLVLLTELPFAAESELESRVKSAYLFHLTKFVDWPNLPNDALRICVLGSPGVGDLLSELSSRPVRDRELRVEVGTVIDPARCQILYLGRNEKNAMDWIARVRGKGVLTVSDREGFASSGGMVGFYMDAGKLKLEVNPDAAKQGNLRVSSKLLEVARSVSTGG